MALTRIRSDNILDREVREQDLADSSVTFDKISITGAVAAGEVLKTDGTGGLFWELASGSSTTLDTLTDVDTTGKIHGDSLVYNIGTGQWEPGSNVPSSLGLGSLTDVTLGPVAQNQFIRHDGAEWVNTEITAAMIVSLELVAITGQIGDLDNVNVAGAVAGERLVFDGAQWRASPALTGSLGSIDNHTDVDTTTVSPGLNDVLSWDGTDWVPVVVPGVGASSNTSVVANITERNTLTPAAGDLAFVRSGVTASEWEMYLWDAAVTDATSFSFTATNTITRIGGISTFPLESFSDGQQFVITGSASNDGTYTIATGGVTDFTITTNEAIATEGAVGATMSGDWIQVSSEDAAATDARTISGDIDVTTISPVLLGNVSSRSRVTLVSIDVSVAFDGSPVLTVGTDGSPTTNAELASDNEMDLSVEGTYTIVTDVEYLNAADTDIKAYFAVGGATVGNARVLVTYV